METYPQSCPPLPDMQPLIIVSNSLLKAIKEFEPMMIIPRVYMLLHRHNRLALTSAILMRDYLTACDRDCPDAPCLHNAAPTIRSTRDNLSLIVDMVNSHPLFILERKSALEAFEEWDDLLDDCTAFADPDVRAALLKMADDASKQAPSRDWRKELYAM